MKHQWLAYVIVAFLSIGAGVAIAGLPDSVPQSETIIPPSTTVAPEPTVPSTTLPAATTTAPEDTATTSTTADDSSADDGSAEDDADGTTTTISTLPERSEVNVAVANGSGRAGVAVSTADELAGLGYANVAALNGEEIVDETIIYYAAGDDASAERMAADLGLPPEAVEPISAAPGVQDLSLVQLLVYIGADRA